MVSSGTFTSLMCAMQRPVLTVCYWSTFIPVRLMLFPYLLFVFPPHLISMGVRLQWAALVLYHHAPSDDGLHM